MWKMVFLKNLGIKSVKTFKILRSTKLLYNFRTSLIFKEQPLMIASQKNKHSTQFQKRTSKSKSPLSWEFAFTYNLMPNLSRCGRDRGKFSLPWNIFLNVYPAKYTVTLIFTGFRHVFTSIFNCTSTRKNLSVHVITVPELEQSLASPYAPKTQSKVMKQVMS